MGVFPHFEKVEHEWGSIDPETLMHSINCFQSLSWAEHEKEGAPHPDGGHLIFISE